MIAGAYQGLFLEMISCMMRPEKILEIGTFTGYSTICLARGLKPEGKLVTIESNEQHRYIIDRFLEEANLSSKVELIIGDAFEVLDQIEDSYDLIYLDAGKQDYPRFFKLLLSKLRPDGFMLIDNCLWHGKVLDEQMDRDTLSIHELNQNLVDTPQTRNILLPVRDGLQLIRKVKTD